jgi:hypothetical protein
VTTSTVIFKFEGHINIFIDSLNKNVHWQGKHPIN